MKYERARELLEKFREHNVLVVGDLMLDRYIRGKAERISPEAPVPVVRVYDETNRPGGAANVAVNVRSLGGGAVPCGIVGADRAGRDLLDVLEAEKLPTGCVLSLPHVRTTVKTRILAGRQQVVRVDLDEFPVLSDGDYARFCAMAASEVKNASAVIIEDYGKGSVRQELVAEVLVEAMSFGVPVALDPKENFDLDVKGIAVATPNRQEAFALAGMSARPPCDNPLEDAPLIDAGNRLIKRWLPELLIITLGPQGMLLLSKDGTPRHIATVAREVFDVSGAGDTVVAAAVLALSSGAGRDEAASLANCAAGVVVGKIGTAACTGEELLSCLKTVSAT